MSSLNATVPLRSAAWVIRLGPKELRRWTDETLVMLFLARAAVVGLLVATLPTVANPGSCPRLAGLAVWFSAVTPVGYLFSDRTDSRPRQD